MLLRWMRCDPCGSGNVPYEARGEMALNRGGNFHLVSALLQSLDCLRIMATLATVNFARGQIVDAVWFAEAVISWSPISIRATLLTSLPGWADILTVLWLNHWTLSSSFFLFFWGERSVKYQYKLNSSLHLPVYIDCVVTGFVSRYFFFLFVCSVVLNFELYFKKQSF